MKEVIFAIFPGCIFFYRYAPKFEVQKIFGLTLMEIVPFLLICIIENQDFTRVMWGFIILYSFYEIGYLANDIWASKYENIGSTKRSQFEYFNFKRFILVRILIIVGVFYFSDMLFVINNLQIIIISGLLMITFLIHNKINSMEYRACTFLVLNLLKILLRLAVISPYLFLYICSSAPHIVIKLIHYLRSKRILSVSDSDLRRVCFPIYLGLIIPMFIIDYRLCIVCLPYLFNHCKHNIRESVIKLLIK